MMKGTVLLACCGLDCAVCPARVAWQTNDDALRQKTAMEWTVQHNFAFTADMINCSGCLASEGPKIGHCGQCEIRACATAKSYAHCGLCTDMATCSKVAQVLNHVPGARERLLGA